MRLGRWLFGLFYRVGYTPWDDHQLPSRLDDLASRLPKGKALDIGCGTGKASIELAKRGWDVTGVDFVEKALRRAKVEASAAGVHVRYVRADATKLRLAGVGSGFDLLIDFCCLHGISFADRDRYVCELSAVAAPGATFLLLGFAPGDRDGPKGFDRAEIERRFSRSWDLVGHAAAPGATNPWYPNADPAWYELRRR